MISMFHILVNLDMSTNLQEQETIIVFDQPTFFIHSWEFFTRLNFGREPLRPFATFNQQMRILTNSVSIRSFDNLATCIMSYATRVAQPRNADSFFFFKKKKFCITLSPFFQQHRVVTGRYTYSYQFHFSGNGLCYAAPALHFHFRPEILDCLTLNIVNHYDS